MTSPAATHTAKPEKADHQRVSKRWGKYFESLSLTNQNDQNHGHAFRMPFINVVVNDFK